VEPSPLNKKAQFRLRLDEEFTTPEKILLKSYFDEFVYRKKRLV
jgi:hypothetical protein